jgi:hypothetical protein
MKSQPIKLSHVNGRMHGRREREERSRVRLRAMGDPLSGFGSVGVFRRSAMLLVSCVALRFHGLDDAASWTSSNEIL